ncbi:hypothetical protein M436DRAFT_41973 [Aureobasidium namibiae CBS 147.97]|uniref:Uncharacterized protein n=1 Tax=Aureobasidium namibiae CBS 147.97 TaxID=1043004 RepID=A0A074XM35_9PEZI|nr:uncharacterized protein M436DRAFT_41973 [Aureobasidium namibiae CBS 147.97]KEQ75606.1 hypothetical protein M436DRAFT_41973 [Aureobasidium namibiae CBS 147.97]
MSRDAALSETPGLARSSALSEDSELAKRSTRARYQERQNAYKRAKYATDPKWRERHNARSTAWDSLQRTSNPEWKASKKESASLYYYTKLREDPFSVIRISLRNWVYHLPLTRDRLSWRKHLPILTDDRVERHCASCHYSPRRGGSRLWWQRRQSLQDGATLYDCNKCFWKDPEIALPQGFEDVKTVQQLFLRREQLLGIKARLRKNALPPPNI